MVYNHFIKIINWPGTSEYSLKQVENFSGKLQGLK